MKSLIFIFLLFQLPFISWAQTTWTDGRFSNTLDIGSIRNSSTHSNVGLSIHRNYNTSFQFAELGHSASHGILFSAYMNSSVSGSLSVTGNTKYYHGPSQYGGGAGAIMFFGNGGTMDFLISPQSTGSNQDIIWGTPKMRIKRDGNVGIGTNSPSTKLHVSSSTSGDAALKIEADTDNNNEADNARIEILQDGGATGAYIGFNSSWTGGSAAIAGGQADNLFRIGTRYSNTDHYERLVINTNNGNVGIGTTTPSEKLEVNGTIRTQEVKVESTPWPDYVFSGTYQLNPLSEVSTYIEENHHLPGIPTAQEVAENGIKLGEMNAKLLEKVEELTLYLIEQNEKIEKQQKEIEILKSKVQ